MIRKSHIVALAGFVALAVAAAVPRPANAAFILGVTYTDGSIVSGPLSFGLASLPASVDATFVLGAGTPGSEPAITLFSTADVVSADIAFGDGAWTVNELISFSMKAINGAVTELVYEFDSITTASVVDGGVLNFPLTITGTDNAAEEAFKYSYASSTQTLTAIPEPAMFTLFLVGLTGLGLAARRRRAA